ncbi:SprT-like family [Arcanobacterium haemolyticum]|uniref:SprT-like domain-containing protein n=1 Tax=Arcanobacterium haemolyticum TaxID=28264 RepID=UPI000D94E76B|nr:SprT-like domain-containing protein [Arcanobacterium haemolyticum]SPT75536.1 SprT-like family [Arcanobacterium haemolyticum]
MNLDDAYRMGRRLMDQHGLAEWTLEFDRAKRRAGATHFAHTKITLSRALTEACPETTVRDTILHEIAHAIVGPRHGHDDVWRRTCVKIGGTGAARLEGAPQIPGAWVGKCPAGHEIQRHRRPTRPMSCATCQPKRFSAKHQFVWRRRLGAADQA